MEIIFNLQIEKLPEGIYLGTSEDMPIEWAKNKADIMALAGIWKTKPRSIEEIRENAWKRRKNNC